MLLRANALAKGYSGARVETVELLLECLNRGVLPRVPAAARSARAATSRRSRISRCRSSARARRGSTASCCRGAEALARAGLEPITLAAKEGLSLDQRHAVHGRDRRARRSCARGGSRSTADIACALSLEALQGSRTSFHPADPRSARPLRGPGRLRRERPPPARGLGDHRVAPLVRQGAGRLLAALRAAGARRLPRPARLRRGDGRGRAERGDRQPARARRRRPASSRTATSTASRSRSRSTRSRWRSPSWRASPSGASSGSSTRASRTGCRRSSTVEGGLNSGFMIPQYVAAALVSARTRSLCHPASVDSIPTSAGQEDHVSMGNAAGLKALAGARERRAGARDRAARRRAGGRVPGAARAGRRRARHARRRARRSRRGCATTARSPTTSSASPTRSATARSSRPSRPRSGSCGERPPLRAPDATPLPKHPYRDSAIFYGVLAVIVVVVTALTGGDLRARGRVRGRATSSSRPRGAGGAGGRSERAERGGAADERDCARSTPPVEALCGDLSRDPRAARDRS